MPLYVSGDSYAKLLHQMRSQIDEQDKIISQHRQDFFNLNSVELVLLAESNSTLTFAVEMLKNLDTTDGGSNSCCLLLLDSPN